MRLPIRIAILILSIAALGSCSKEEMLLPIYENAELGKMWEGFDPESDYLVVVGDVQTYVAEEGKYLPYFNASMRWVAHEVGCGAPIQGMLFVGDLTDNNSEQQWRTFRRTADIAAPCIPTVGCSGNHDFDWKRGKNPNDENFIAILSRASTGLTRYACFAGLEDRIVERYDASIDNICVELTIHGSPLYLLSLEFSPRPDVLKWAAEIISHHPEKRFLIMTHEMLHTDGSLIESGSFGQQQFAPYGIPYSNPIDVWERLIYPYDNVIACLCGHNAYSLQLLKENSAGREVPIVLFNLQYRENGGNGELELWEFTHGGEVRISIISTLTGQILSSPLNFALSPESSPYHAHVKTFTNL